MLPAKKPSPVIIALIVVVLVGLAVAAAAVVNQQKEVAPEATQTQQPATDTAADTSADTQVTYKDGTYTEKGRYISPGGGESIEVTLMIANDIITSASVASNATSGEAEEYQEKFISGYKSSVVGKDIDEVSLSRVAGSSLTSNGFNAAVELIKADAEA
ncbi:MAG: hypothetical protein JWO54_551 [Candidatus Saccharibacteria bacterium]|nr:hypothetical protein [Candidatus Saccharibacteria bacterium]MDB5180788.1 hypothetical protein [Candidatus Saccharibacteria bacterium]MDB5180791.1 hypothetical protein [Candidatus Saccharibacteria bacterium]